MSIAEAFEGVLPARPAPPEKTQELPPVARATAAPKARPVRTTRASWATRTRSRVRREVQVVYLDTADSWLLTGRAPSAKDIWRADYAANVPADFAPFVMWCRAYRVPAVLVALLLDGTKWLLVHPVRGPLTLLTAVATTAAVNL